MGDYRLSPFGPEPRDRAVRVFEGRAALEQLGANLRLCVAQLIQMANDNGGRDNISVILARVKREYPAPRGVVAKLAGWFK